jgi:hypothetical protein
MENIRNVRGWDSVAGFCVVGIGGLLASVPESSSQCVGNHGDPAGTLEEAKSCLVLSSVSIIVIALLS